MRGIHIQLVLWVSPPSYDWRHLAHSSPLVWAKRWYCHCSCNVMSLTVLVFSFPYFPGEIIDPNVDPEDIPSAVFENRSASEAQNMARGGRTWLVRFFDTQASFGWIPISRLDMLGENDGPSLTP